MIPVLQALLLAENVWKTIDGRHIIAGTFNAIMFTRKENLSKEVESEDGQKVRLIKGGRRGSPYAFLSLTDVCEDTTLQLQFVSLNKNEVLFRTEIRLQSVNRLATYEIPIELPELNVPEAGTYAFEVVCEGELIGSRRIVAKEMPLNEDE